MRSTKPMSRGSLSIVLAIAVVAMFAIAGTSTAFAATCTQPFNCFAGDDGNQATGPNGLQDWQDIAATVTAINDPAKGIDTKFNGGAKETQPGGWDFITGNNTPKDDITQGWAKFDGRFLYAAFQRVKQNGDTFLAFELNQDPAGPRISSAGIPIPHRSEGDILFTYDIATTNTVSFGMCTWKGGADSGQWMLLDGITPVGGSIKECTKLDPSTVPAAEGNVNWKTPINPNYLGANPIGAGQFGEAVVDLGALGTRFVTNPCAPNGWVWMHSRASRSVVSQPKDVLGGNPIASPTCDQPSPGGGPLVNPLVPPQQTPVQQQSPGGQLVLGERITPGRARLLGPAGCTASAFHARIKGVRIARVVFTLDGHRLATVTRKNYRGTYAVRIDPRRMRFGVHRLVARVTFQRGSATKAKTFRLSFQRCPRALRAPRFTG